MKLRKFLSGASAILMAVCVSGCSVLPDVPTEIISHRLSDVYQTAGTAVEVAYNDTAQVEERTAENTPTSGQCGENVYWNFDEDTGTLTISGTGEMYDYMYNSEAWKKSNIKNVIIGSGITSIGSGMFDNCKSLTSIAIPDSVTSIGDWAFAWCTSLTSITIPDSVTSIGDWAFFGCSSLTSINVSSSNKNYCSLNGILFNKDKSEIVCYPAGITATSYTIPDSVTSIGSEAFYGCSSLTSITIPDSVTSIAA